MSAVKETIEQEIPKPKTVPILNRTIDFLSSVRFGVVLLCILVAFSMVGMLIIQQNVQGFDAFYASRTPAEKYVLGGLGIFDIYHSWYYNFLLLILSLNIVLASIDRFPSAWTFIAKPKLDASRRWLLGQKTNAVVNIGNENEEKAAERVSRIFKKNGLSATITEKKGNLYVFGESGKWNRLGAYIVHVFLLTLFLGHFVALQSGFDADVRLTPDTNEEVQKVSQSAQKTDQIQMIQFNLDKQERYSVQLPFTITVTDIQQTLIDPKGTVAINNTMDWRTQIKIDDPAYGQTIGDVSLNKPFEYRGYRFFQASAITVGSARTMNLNLTPQNGGEPFQVELKRNGTTELPDGTKVEYGMFLPDFAFENGQPTTRTGEYNNPVVILNVTPPNGAAERVFAFGGSIGDKIPVGAPKLGYKWRLGEFEKVPIAHVLSIKYDPYNAAFIAWYIGGFGLIGALCFVFFISHRRVWALIDRENGEIALGGNTNRSQPAFEDKFKKIVGQLEGNTDADDI